MFSLKSLLYALRTHKHDGKETEKIKYSDLIGTPAAGGGGLTAVATDATLDGDGTDGAPLSVLKLGTPRTLALSGDVTGSASFDGSGNATIAATVGNDSHTHGAGSLTSVFAASSYGFTEVWQYASKSAPLESANPAYISYTPEKDCLLFGHTQEGNGSYLNIRIGAGPSEGKDIDISIHNASSTQRNGFCFGCKAGVTVYFSATVRAVPLSLRYMPFGS